MKIISGLFLLFILAVVPAAAQDKKQDAAAAPVVTQDVTVEVMAAPVAEVKVAAPTPEPQQVMDFKMSAEGNVSLDFREAEIKNVLKVLAYKSGMNIIAGPEVVGQVNIQLKDVPWQKAMDVILSTYGYSYEQRGTVLMVTTVDNLKKRREDSKSLAEQEPLATRTFLLNFSKAEDVLKTLDKMKTTRGSVNFDQRTNAVILTDVESNVSRLMEVIQRLDTVTPQILIEARIIETALNSQEILGMQWPTSVGGTATMPVRTHTFPWTGSADQHLPATGWVNPSIGADGSVAKTVTSNNNLLTYGTLSLSDLTMTLNMLQSRTNTNVLSNPRIVTLDNQPAKISVGNKYPLPKYALSDTQDKLILSGWEYIEYGLTFNVTPHINGRGLVTLDLEPTIIDSPGTVKFGGATATAIDIPVLSTESAKTSVMIKDGETLVIAGLIKDKKIKTEDRVPFLGDIPFLGVPFRHKNDTIVKTELLIFLTPHIITPELGPRVEKASAGK